MKKTEDMEFIENGKPNLSLIPKNDFETLIAFIESEIREYIALKNNEENKPP